MSIYDVGKSISYCLTSYAGLVDADVVYNDGKYAVAAFEFYGDNELDDFILSSDEVMLFVPANFGYGQNCYLIIDLETGFLVKRHEWQRKNGLLYVVGKDIAFDGMMICCIAHAVTVWVGEGVAIVRVPYKSHFNAFYAQFGYEKEVLREKYPAFDDDEEDSAYMCVRIADDEILDIEGNSIEEHVRHCFYTMLEVDMTD